MQKLKLKQYPETGLIFIKQNIFLLSSVLGVKYIYCENIYIFTNVLEKVLWN